MRTTCHKTPQQLYTAGSLLLQNSNIEALDSADVHDNYGIDPTYISSTPNNELVDVPVNPVKFSHTDLQMLQM